MFVFVSSFVFSLISIHSLLSFLSPSLSICPKLRLISRRTFPWQSPHTTSHSFQPTDLKIQPCILYDFLRRNNASHDLLKFFLPLPR